MVQLALLRWGATGAPAPNRALAGFLPTSAPQAAPLPAITPALSFYGADALAIAQPAALNGISPVSGTLAPTLQRASTVTTAFNAAQALLNEALVAAAPAPSPEPVPAAPPSPTSSAPEQVSKPAPVSAPSKPAAPPAPEKWAWPVHGNVTSPFGPRRDPITGAPSTHSGLDIGAAKGSPIRAPLTGQVTFAGWKGGYGNYVVIDHGNGLQTAYAHQSEIDVHVGEAVAAGQQVGRVGSTGYSTGPHLHFEVMRAGRFVDPRPYLG